jgi:hypothetical protein
MRASLYHIQAKNREFGHHSTLHSDWDYMLSCQNMKDVGKDALYAIEIWGEINLLQISNSHSPTARSQKIPRPYFQQPRNSPLLSKVFESHYYTGTSSHNVLQYTPTTTEGKFRVLYQFSQASPLPICI